MNLGELIEAYRYESKDTNVPPFVSDDKALEFANQAENEACRRSGLLRDSKSNVCCAQVSANEATVEISPKIIDIVRVKTSLSPYPLSFTQTDAMDSCMPGWEDHSGIPTTYITDYQTGVIRLYPTPASDCDISMTVTRIPLSPMEDDEDCPEIREDTHPALVKWMLYRAYSSDDSDLFNPKQAEKSLREFEIEFGTKKSIRNERWASERNMMSAPPIA